MIELISIDERFYNESGSVMGVLYTTTGHRYNWGFVQRDLRDGKQVHIRPANVFELEHFERKLAEYKAHDAG